MDRRRSFIALLTGGLALWTGRGARAAAPETRKHRVVFDLSAAEAERWDGALRNVENLRKAFGPENVEAELVVHGKAYPLLQKTSPELEARLRSLSEDGVRLALCQNTMRRFNVAPESLFPFAVTVDAAVAELVRKQEAGWAYIKTG